MDRIIVTHVALGRALRDSRLAHGWTQAELARQAGVAQPTVSNIERGVSPTSLKTLLPLLAALELELVLRPRESHDAAQLWEES